MSRRLRPAPGLMIYVAFTTILGLYFAYASVQGKYGILSRVGIDAELADLRTDLVALREEVAAQENRTRRLSDDYLDLDLLDEQAREILGLVRADEVILR